MDEYSTNIKRYFEKVETNASATRMDFLTALEKLTLNEYLWQYEQL